MTVVFRLIMFPWVTLGMALAVMSMSTAFSTAAHADSVAWNGLWFECEFSGRQAPPGDDCAMLDDDGFFFEEGKVTYMKVMDSIETDACKKQRAGQCFKADTPAITVKASRTGKAVFTDTSIGMRFLACTQIFI